MSSERVNSNISIKKLEKNLINLPYNKLPSFRINPFTQKQTSKETSIMNLTVYKNSSSSSPGKKNKQKEIHQVLPPKKGDKVISLSSDKDKMSIDSTKYSYKKGQSTSNYLTKSENKPNCIPLPTNSNIDIINNSNLHIKTEINYNSIHNLNNSNQSINNANSSNLTYNDIIPKTTTNEKIIFNYNFARSNKSISEGTNNNSKKLILTNSALQNSGNNNPIMKQNNYFNTSLKNKSNNQSPIHERKIESRLGQYQRNIKMNNKFSIIGQNQRILNLSHKIKSPAKEINVSSSKHSMEINNNYNENTSFLNYFAKINNYEPSKYGLKPNGIVTSYAANTNQGLFRYLKAYLRNYNEDRVSIILNVIKPNSRKNEDWPKCSFFAIYDGHGGNKCADFLKENLHQYIFRESCFPYDPKKAIFKGFQEAEKKFSQLVFPNKNIQNNEIDRSGSCAIVIIILDDICYIANLGDSRAIYSEDSSKKVYLLSQDHKPNDENERKRIEMNGGFVYQGQLNALNRPILINSKMPGPYRVFPGRLSVSRCFGDIEAKATELGGNPKVLISTPDIISFRINEESDFIVFGSDGIFDKLSNKDILSCIWSCTNEEIFSEDLNKQSGSCVDSILKNALVNSSMDNVTCIFICFENFKRTLYQEVYSDSLEKFEQIRLRVSCLDTFSFKLKEDENINFFHILDKTNDILDEKIDKRIEGNEVRKEINEDSTEKEASNIFLPTTKINNNNKINKKFCMSQSDFSKLSVNVLNFADCLKRNKKNSEGHMKKRSPDEPLYPYVDKSVNLSINDQVKRRINESNVLAVKRLNNSLSKPQTTNGLKNSFHFLNK